MPSTARARPSPALPRPARSDPARDLLPIAPAVEPGADPRDRCVADADSAAYEQPSPRAMPRDGAAPHCRRGAGARPARRSAAPLARAGAVALDVAPSRAHAASRPGGLDTLPYDFRYGRPAYGFPHETWRRARRCARRVRPDARLRIARGPPAARGDRRLRIARCACAAARTTSLPSTGHSRCRSAARCSSIPATRWC